MIRSLVLVLVVLSAGCSAAPKGDAGAASSPAPASPPTSRAPAAPTEIVEIAHLTDQREVWDCPKCGMVFDRTGMCTMCNAELVRKRVDYSCAADGKPVDRAGACPRCPVPVQVTKTAIAPAAESPALGGK